jgi:hypothetical protein
MTFRVKHLSVPSLFLLVIMAMDAQNSVLQAKEPVVVTAGFAGRWVDQENTDNKMSVAQDNGVFRVTAGDDAYGYRLSCLVKKKLIVCSGDGGLLEGENFLYQSTFEFNTNGSVVENWKAFNNLQTASGKTIWKRQ